jgi:glyceraldehyde 3-phosphate dehydrogenase
MMVKIGINGFGRIGRVTFRIAMRFQDEIEIVGINDIMNPKTMAHLLKYDSIYGTLKADVTYDDKNIYVDGKKYPVFSEKNVKNVDWSGLGTEILVEASGKYSKDPDIKSELGGTVKKILVTAPATNDDITIVLGANDEKYDPAVHDVVSGASCTTCGLAAILHLLDQTYGVKRGMTTSIHSYTNDQKILDVSHKDLRRARAAGMSIIPTTTGAAKAITKVLPEFKGKMSCYAARVPTPDVSIVDIVLELDKAVELDALNNTFKEAAAGKYKGIIDWNDDELVSVDFRGNENTIIVDLPLNMVMDGNMVKIVAWYDNEWGYGRRVIDLVRFMKEKGL